MRRFLIRLLISISIIGLIIVALNLEVTTRQGIDYKWHSIKMPLYLKVLDFYDRHFHYQLLTKRILNGEQDEAEKIMRIFLWTYKNIKRQPEGLPVIDDHVWHIIVRGYGVIDQLSDVFTTLCNYAGVTAFYEMVYTEDRSQAIPLSFVKINGKWTVFDPYKGSYFKNKTGKFAGVNELANGKWELGRVNKSDTDLLDYSTYFHDLTVNVEKRDFKRAQIQSPLRRLLHEMKRIIKI